MVHDLCMVIRECIFRKLDYGWQVSFKQFEKQSGVHANVNKIWIYCCIIAVNYKMYAGIEHAVLFPKILC